MNSREKLLRSLSSVQFALWELHLYLNTHPNDLSALAMHEKYDMKFRQNTVHIVKVEKTCQNTSK